MRALAGLLSGQVYPPKEGVAESAHPARALSIYNVPKGPCMNSEMVLRPEKELCVCIYIYICSM